MDMSAIVTVLSSPEVVGTLASFAAVLSYVVRLTYRTGARFREHDLREAQMQEQLDAQAKDIERLLKHMQSHYYMTQEEARKFLHYHEGTVYNIRHT